MSRKSLALAVLAVIALSVLRVEAEIWLDIDLFYYWLGAMFAIIGSVFGGLWTGRKGTKPARIC